MIQENLSKYMDPALMMIGHTRHYTVSGIYQNLKYLDLV